jgi:proline dehydrogenase
MDRLPAARRFVRRFVAGPALEDALAVAARLNGDGVDAAITHLGENVATTDDAAHAADAYLEVLDAIARRRLRAVPSLKLTHLGLDLGDAVCRANLERVAARGIATGTLVWVDMESSAYTDRTLELYRRLHATHSNLACVVQSYLRRTAQDVERLIEIGATVRLCKGAYREPPELAFPDKRDVDASYARCLDRLLSADALARRVYPAFATHDERLIDRALETARAGGVAADRYELQMLYGIRHDLHARLRGAGLRLRVLIPYGEDWYGYFMRRLAERPANLAFFFRQVIRGSAP